MLEVRSLSFSYTGSKVLDDISFDAAPGDFISVLGPNGAGKSTLFRCILGFSGNYEGSIALDGKNIKDYSQKELAACIAYIPQIHKQTFGFSVLDTVLMGRTHAMSAFQKPGKKETAEAMAALEKLSVDHLADRDFSRLSGGEQQLVLIARAIAQDSGILVMDEPTSALDFGNQLKVLERVSSLADDGYTVLLSTHNPQHALSYSNKTLALINGKLDCFGLSQEIINEELMNRLYSVPVSLEKTPYGNTIVPVRRRGMFQWKPEMIRFMKDASEYGSYYQRLADEMLPYLKPDDILCDAGCGLGHLSTTLSPYVKELVAADINKDALKVLEETLEGGAYPNVSAVRCDMNSLPQRHYDGLIFCFNGSNKDIWEISQTLKPDKIFIMKKNYDIHRFSVGTYREPSSDDRDDLKFWEEKGFDCIRKEIEAEFGQPFRTVDDARLFFNTYSVDDDKSVITDEYLMGRLEKTGRSDFPYYLPHMRKIRFIVLQNKG